MKKFWKPLSLIWKILVISFLLGCQQETAEHFEGSLEGLPDEQSDSVTTVTMNGNVVTMEMYARHIDRFYDKKETFIDSLHVKQFDNAGELTSILTCQRAKIDETKNVIICEGDVVIDSENGVLKTPKLTWNRNTDDVLAENGVTLQREDDSLAGDKMKTDIKMSYVEIVNVSAEGKVEGEKLEW